MSAVLPNGLTTKSNGIKTATHNSTNNHIAINFTTADGISPALLTATSAAMPLNLNVNSMPQQVVSNGNGLQIITPGHANIITTNGKNGIRKSALLDEHTTILSKEQIKMDSEPPTKVIKLVNGSTIALASMDKEHKLIPSGQLTLSQVVVSQIPLLASSQGLRVIGQAPNGLATIELSNPTSKYTIYWLCLSLQLQIFQFLFIYLWLIIFPVQQRNMSMSNLGPHQTATLVPNGANGAQLHKLLVSGAPPTAVTTTLATQQELARLPGGAELNILPTGTNGATIYRGGNGKLAIVNNGLTIKGKRYLTHNQFNIF